MDRPLTELQIDYRAELNDQQYEAVTAPPGPALVLAGAGSGKTRTLTYRVAFLLEQGIPPERILLLTFTNKAAREMMSRVAGLLGRELRELWGGTFHSVGARILRSYGESIGVGANFTILDRSDSEDLLATCLAECGIDRKDKEFPKVDAIADMFSQSANRRLGLAGWFERIALDGEAFLEKLEEVRKVYQERKRAAQCYDFDDLLGLWLELLEKDAEAREAMQRRFQFVLVDEYQDTNRLQSDLIDLLGAKNRNVMVVGDDSQSIYSWRGAEFRNILDFPKRYPGAAVFKIETNYRSTPEILDVANAAIATNTEQFEKALRASLDPGGKPAVVECSTGRTQARFLADRITDLIEEGVSPGEIAVLYRSHFHALELQLELSRRQIRHQVTSGIRFFEQAHVKDAVAFLRLLANPGDEVSFRRLARMAPGVGEKSAAKLWGQFLAAWNASDAASPDRVSRAFASCAEKVPARAKPDWKRWAEAIAECETSNQPGTAVQVLLKSGYEDYVKMAYDNVEKRLEDLSQLRQFAMEFSDTREFLTQLALYSGLETEAARDDEGEGRSVRLSTIHQAKGLEFEAVFVINLAEGLFPSRRAMEDEDQIEEERRLFYVAVTRAKKYLTLTYPSVRRSAQGWEESAMPSRFLGEIGKNLVNFWSDSAVSW